MMTGSFKMTAIVSTCCAPSATCEDCKAGLKRFVDTGRDPDTDERVELLYHSKDGVLVACADQTRPAVA